MPSNLARVASGQLGMTPSEVKDATGILVTRKRLVRAFGRARIDGISFNRAEVADPIEVIKDSLRRRYNQVVDVRTVDEPTKVASGPPKMVILGTERVQWAEACKRAGRSRAVLAFHKPDIPACPAQESP